MDKIKNIKSFMRIVHRYLGYFMAGMMTVYAVSGILLVYRDTNFLKINRHYDKIIDKNLSPKDIGTELKIKKIKITKVDSPIYYFKNGSYNAATGEAVYNKDELPKFLDMLTKLHKAPSKENLGGINALFGVSLFFFVISSFWMFNPKSAAFRRGMWYTAAGLIITVVMIFFSA